MGFKYKNPSIKIGGMRIRKNKKGYSISRKTLTGGRKTYNTSTGKTTRTYKTGIKGLSYSTTTDGFKKVSRSSRSSTKSVTSNRNKGLIAIMVIAVIVMLKYLIVLVPVVLIIGGVYWYATKKSFVQEDDSKSVETEKEIRDSNEDNEFEDKTNLSSIDTDDSDIEAKIMSAFSDEKQ